MKAIKKIVCDIYSRVSGYYQPVGNWNKGKKEEYKERLQVKMDTIRARLKEEEIRKHKGL